MKKSEKTKQRIVQYSLDLFNEQGPDNVSTVQISKVMGISPGNLYYHFGNKEEIIREIYEEMVHEYKENWNIKEMLMPDFNPINKLVNNLRIFFKYRFLVNNMCLLINNDPLLNMQYKTLTSERQGELEQYFRFLEVQGIMDFGNSDSEIKKLVSILWFLGDFWLMHKEVSSGKTNELTQEMELEYLQTNLFLTGAFLTPRGKEWLHSMQQEYLKT